MEKKEKAKQKWMYIAAAVVIAVIAAVLISAFGNREETYRSIKIIELEGGVTIEREGVGVLEASSNMNLISGDSVETGQDSYAVLQLDTDKYVMLGESGRMIVVAEGDETDSRTAIHLEAGSVLSEIQNPLSSGSSYDIVTPNATMSVRGTVFEVRKNGEADSGRIEVLVYDGKVAVGLDGAEDVLYEAGEYTLFTAGEKPQFIIERAEITEELLNGQMMERLERINSQSRELNLGTVQLGEAAYPEPAAAPSQAALPAASTRTDAPAPSAAPDSGDVSGATQILTGTSQAAANGTAAGSADNRQDYADQTGGGGRDRDNTEINSENQNPESTQQPDDSSKSDGNSESNGNSGSNGSSNNDNSHGQSHKPWDGTWDFMDYQNLWKSYTMADYQQTVSGGNAEEAECTVIYYLPYIAEAAECPEGSSSKLRYDAPRVHFSTRTTAGSLLTAPEIPSGLIDYQWGRTLNFAGWCLEDGTMWNFEGDTVKTNTCLYPVWSDDQGKYYYPVICRSEEVWTYYCNCVKEGSLLEGLYFSDSWGAVFHGWERVNHENAVWDPESDVVQGAESLKAAWSR